MYTATFYRDRPYSPREHWIPLATFPATFPFVAYFPRPSRVAVCVARTPLLTLGFPAISSPVLQAMYIERNALQTLVQRGLSGH